MGDEGLARIRELAAQVLADHDLWRRNGGLNSPSLESLRALLAAIGDETGGWPEPRTVTNTYRYVGAVTHAPLCPLAGQWPNRGICEVCGAQVLEVEKTDEFDPPDALVLPSQQAAKT